MFQPLFSPKKEIFFVILRPKGEKRHPASSLNNKQQKNID